LIYLYSRKCGRIFRHAGCTGKNIAAFFVMLAAPVKMLPHFSSCWLHRQKYRRIFAYPARVSK
jgi:hypothetical protein